MAISNKRRSDKDAPQITQKVYNESGATLGVDGWLAGAVGRSIVAGYPSSTTETYSYYEIDSISGASTLMFQYTITYTDSTKSTLQSATRTA